MMHGFQRSARLCMCKCVCVCVVGVGGSESSIDRVRVTRSPESCGETKLLEML